MDLTIKLDMYCNLQIDHELFNICVRLGVKISYTQILQALCDTTGNYNYMVVEHKHDDGAKSSYMAIQKNTILIYLMSKDGDDIEFKFPKNKYKSCFIEAFIKNMEIE